MPATQPTYYDAPLIGATSLSASVDTSFTAPTHAASVVTSSASAQTIYQLRFIQTATTAATSYVNLFLYDGSAYHYFDVFAVPIYTMGAGSAQSPPIDKFYRNLDIPAGWSLLATTATTASVGNVIAFGGS